MIDEMWMRGWNDNHARFSIDAQRGLHRLAAGLGVISRRGMKAAKRERGEAGNGR